MTAVHSVLVAGHLCIDITPELTDVPELVPGQLYEIGSAQLTLGGCVANTGLALAAAGVPTRVCSRVGNDPLGEIARRLLAERGMGLEDVTTTGGSSMKAIEALRAEGALIDHVITIVDRLEGAAQTFQAAAIPSTSATERRVSR